MSIVPFYGFRYSFNFIRPKLSRWVIFLFSALLLAFNCTPMLTNVDINQNPAHSHTNRNVYIWIGGWVSVWKKRPLWAKTLSQMKLPKTWPYPWQKWTMSLQWIGHLLRLFWPSELSFWWLPFPDLCRILIINKIMLMPCIHLFNGLPLGAIVGGKLHIHIISMPLLYFTFIYFY